MNVGKINLSDQTLISSLKKYKKQYSPIRTYKTNARSVAKSYEQVLAEKDYS